MIIIIVITVIIIQVLGGSWVVTSISGVVSRITIVIAHIMGLVTPRITTHEPPSNPEAEFSATLVGLASRGDFFKGSWNNMMLRLLLCRIKGFMIFGV